MKIVAMVFGIIGSIIAYMMQQFFINLHKGASWAIAVTHKRELFLLVPAIGLIGAIIVKKKPLIGAVLMLVSTVAFLYSPEEINGCGLIPAIPLSVGAILGFISSRKLS